MSKFQSTHITRLGMGLVVQAVKDFHIGVDQPVRDRLQQISQDEADFRKRLIEEEVFTELFAAIDRGDLVGIADGIMDGIFVLVGTGLHYGIPMAAVWEEVCRSNMSKIDPETGKAPKRADGKVLKGPHFSPADVVGVLEREGGNG